MTLAQVADELGCTKSTVAKVERDESAPKLDFISRYLRVVKASDQDCLAVLGVERSLSSEAA
jgi:transcriptional regulator with XRE-family HTH domain